MIIIYQSALKLSMGIPKNPNLPISPTKSKLHLSKNSLTHSSSANYLTFGNLSTCLGATAL